jgi:neutral ceramidase
MEVQVFRLDSDTAIVGLPCEIFVELGLAIKAQSPFKKTIVMSICNDRPSYVPTLKAFKEGSYEITNARVKPGVGEMLVETAVKLLGEAKQ